MHISKHNETEMFRLSDEELRTAILDLTKEYSRRKHINSGFGDSKIVLKGVSRIDYAARVLMRKRLLQQSAQR